MSSARLLLGQLRAARSRAVAAADGDRNVDFNVCNSVNSIRRALINGHPDIREYVEALTNYVESSDGNPPYPASGVSVLFLCDQLIEILQSHEGISRASSGEELSINRIAPDSKKVFVVHGHDEVNLLRLKILLKDRYNLMPMILMEEASSGQTIIEKFENAAKEAAFCVVLMTPDDQVKSLDNVIAQARPNVIFELGWFHGRLGRSRVCILSKRGTSIHSDLSGIVRIEFIDKIEETIPDLERELRRAGLLL